MSTSLWYIVPAGRNFGSAYLSDLQRLTICLHGIKHGKAVRKPKPMCFEGSHQ